MEILAEIQPLDAGAGTRTTLRLASADDKRITAVSSQRWWPAITRKPTLRHDWFDGDFTGQIVLGSASLRLAMFGMRKANSAAAALRYAAAPVTLHEIDPAVGTPTAIFQGIVGGYSIENETLTLDLKVDTAKFEGSALTLTYAGTGGAEGPADLKGKVKPWALGAPKNVEAVLIDVVNSVYQVSAYGAIQGIPTVYERASSFGASVGDFATYALLVAASIPAGRWGTCLAAGMFRLGAPAAGLITADVEGDKPGGTWLRKTGEIINRICTNGGVGGAFINSTSLTALDTTLTTLLPNDGRISVYLTEQVKILDLVQDLARPCNAAVGVSFLGELFVCRTVIGTPGTVLDAQGRRLPPVSDCEERNVSPPYWRIEMTANRNNRVHAPADIAFTAELRELGDYSGSVSYREGNIVTNQGARWLYINIVATAGNAPPTLPTTSNSFWTQLSGRTDYANIVGATRPDANATPAGNLQINSRMATDSAGYNFTDTGGARAAGTNSPPTPWVVAINAASFNPGSQIILPLSPVSGGSKVFIEFKVMRTGALTTLNFTGDVFNALTQAGIGPIASGSVVPTAANTWQTFKFSGTVNGEAGFIGISFQDMTGNTGRVEIGDPSVSYSETGADVTALVAPDVQGNLLWELNADFAGTITTALPATRRFVAMQGNTDVSASSTWALSSVPSTVALTVNNSGDRGLLTLGTGTTTGGTCKLTVTFPSGTIIERIITLTKTNAPAPITGGSGATSASDTTLTTVSSGSHATISDELQVRSDGANKVRISVGSAYRGAGADVQVAFKAAYATTSGGSLTDIFSEINGTTSVWDAVDSFQYAGNMTLAETQYTLPSPNTDYFFKLQARRVSGSGDAVFESSQFLVRQ